MVVMYTEIARRLPPPDLDDIPRRALNAAHDTVGARARPHLSRGLNFLLIHLLYSIAHIFTCTDATQPARRDVGTGLENVS